MIHESAPETQASTPDTLPCPKCGTIDKPTLLPGSGPHACKASCGHCGRFLKLISLLSPSERMAHRVKARLKAMQAVPASEAQMDFLKALGFEGPPPETMAAAAERIEELKAGQEAQRSNAPGRTP